jgi:hypothetical protein
MPSSGRKSTYPWCPIFPSQLYATHIAHTEGWGSPLVAAGIIVTLCAAVTPPFAERAAKTGQPAKAVLFWTFFALAVSFSLSASIARSSGYASGKVATVEQANEGAKLAKEAYEAAKQTQQDECKKRGARCRAAEDAVTATRAQLATVAPVQSADPGAERLAAVLGIQSSTVQLYAPLLLPLGLELGGFIFLAAGLAPTRRRDDEIAVATEAQEAAKSVLADATEMQEIAILVAEIAKPAATGTRAYYLARLQREFPELAAQVASGELSVFRASVQAGLRKAPVKASKWTKADAYMPRPSSPSWITIGAGPSAVDGTEVSDLPPALSSHRAWNRQSRLDGYVAGAK